MGDTNPREPDEKTRGCRTKTQKPTIRTNLTSHAELEVLMMPPVVVLASMVLWLLLVVCLVSLFYCYIPLFPQMMFLVWFTKAFNVLIVPLYLNPSHASKDVHFVIHLCNHVRLGEQRRPFVSCH